MHDEEAIEQSIHMGDTNHWPDAMTSEDDGICWQDVSSLEQHDITHQKVKDGDVLHLAIS